jgi:Ca2+-binding RTX toxin-like protein
MARRVSFAGLVGFASMVIVGGALAVTERGGAGPDRLSGTRGADTLKGRAGPDRLDGRAGDDVLVGGGGKDVLRGGPGYDEFNARRGEELPAAGKDRIKARDGEPDLVSCGAGIDIAIVDAEEDGVFDCEEVREP